MLDDLFGPGSLTAKAIRRSILRYSLRPVEYKFDRLPPPEAYRDMELAFREDYFEPLHPPGQNLLRYLKYTLLIFSFIALQATVGTLGFLGLTGFLFFFMPYVFTKQLSAQIGSGINSVVYLIILVVLLVTSFLVARYLENPYLATVLFGEIALALILSVGKDFSNFAHDWIYTHPILSNEERRNAPPITHGANWMLALFLFGVLAFLPLASVFLTHLVFLATVVLAIIWGPIFEKRRKISLAIFMFYLPVSRLCTVYFNYGNRFPRPLPGIWLPKRSFYVRRRYALLLLLSVFCTLTAGTYLFLPWDAPGLRTHFADQYVEFYYDSLLPDQKEVPRLTDLETLPAELNKTESAPPVPEGPAEPRPRILPQDELMNLQTRLTVLNETDLASLPLDERLALGQEMDKIREKIDSSNINVKALAQEKLRQQVDTWLDVLLAAGPFEAPGLFVLCILTALCGAVLYPLLFFLAIYQRPLVELADLWWAIDERANTGDARSLWDHFVNRIANSKHIAKFEENSSQAEAPNPRTEFRESDHLFLGLEADNGFPMLLHRSIVSDHVYISGGTGAGKTSLGILSLLVQLIRGNPAQTNSDKDQTPADNVSTMPPIVIIDLKGEYSLLHTVRDEVRKKAEQEGRKLEDCFRLFTSEKDTPTHYFNPLADMARPDRYLSDLCNLLLDALELNHGPGYGRSFFSRKNYMVLHELLRSNPHATFAELSDAMTKYAKSDREGAYQAFELLATLYGLMEFKQLHPPPSVPAADTINMTEVIRTRQVAYFWLPTVESSIIAREIANLALFSYFSAMRAQAKQRGSLTQAYLVVDEFQKLAGDRFSVILQQARGFGLSAILSNQSIADLKTPSFDLRPAVLQNTRLKMYFSFSDFREMRDFAQRSGEELAYTRSGIFDLSHGDEPDFPLFQQWKHSIKPRITTNDILAVSDHPLQAFAEIRAGAGYTQFGGSAMPVQMFHPVRWSDFVERRDKMPWPSLEDLGRTASVKSTVSPEEVDRKAMETLARLEAKVHGLDEEFPHLKFS